MLIRSCAAASAVVKAPEPSGRMLGRQSRLLAVLREVPASSAPRSAVLGIDRDLLQSKELVFFSIAIHETLLMSRLPDLSPNNSVINTEIRSILFVARIAKHQDFCFSRASS